MPLPFVVRNLRDHPTELLLEGGPVVLPARGERGLSAADRATPQVAVLERRRVLAIRRCGGPVDLNTATAAQLEGLPEVGPATARAIVEHRGHNGPFARLSELGHVRGIGPRTVSAFEALEAAGHLVLHR